MKIISSAPARISLFGGSTDVGEYCKKYGGAVISMAINIYSHVTLLTDDDMWQQTAHVFPQNTDPKLFSSILTHFNLNGMHHLRMISEFDGEIGAGLASSGSATIALLGAIYKRKGMEVVDPMALAHHGWEVEKAYHHTGQQDHYAAVFGRMNLFQFQKGNVTRTEIERAKALALQKWLVLCYIGGVREHKDGQKTLEELTPERKYTLDQMMEVTALARSAISINAWAKIGELLDSTWTYKQLANPHVSNQRVNALYKYARENGALGGKLLGSGQGGYMIFSVPPEDQKTFITMMRKKGVEQVDYSLDFNGVQTKIV